MLIRIERPSEVDVIDRLTRVAFEPMPFSSGTEAPILRALRSSDDLTLSLVADDDGVVVGHVAFSPVTVDGRHDGWYGLGPISVRADRQRQGIGRALVEEGLRRLGEHASGGVVLVGDPEIYGRMGFVSDGGLRYHGVDARFVQYLALGGDAPKGELLFAAAFESETA